MDKIIDIHNHILPNVDDGSISYDEAINSILYLKEKGIKDIFLTSHYVFNSKYQATVSFRKDIYDTLCEKLNDSSVNLYLGNEVYVSDIEQLLKDIKDNNICTLNNSKYLLIEFPMHHKLNYMDTLICELNAIGIIPIIAHPERYSYFDIDEIDKLLEYNCLLQCNIGSYSGEYGRKAKKNLKLLLKNNYVTFLATDFHHITGKDYIDKGLQKLEKKYGFNKINELVYENPKAVIFNENI